MKKSDEIILVKTELLKKNEITQGIYGTPENYDEIKMTIKTEGVIQPLVVNKSTMEIVSGNLRHKAALELGIEEVPVILWELDANEMEVIAIFSNQQRKKTYLEKLKEIKFFNNYYKINQGVRTDLNPDLKELKEHRDAMLAHIPKYEKDYLISIDKLASELYNENSNEYLRVFANLENPKRSLSGVNQQLIDLRKRKHNDQIMPDKYEFLTDNVKIYNKSSVDMAEVKTGSVHCIICSPGYFQMKDYGTGKQQLGMEPTVEEYFANLMPHFKECFRVLRDDGSLFVNINDCADDCQYNAIPQKFVLKMLEMGWILNDEILWIKRNPTYSRGKRSVRSHEPIFQFVKTKDFYYDDNWLKLIADPNNRISYGTNNTTPKIISGLNFRDGILITNVADTRPLREECLEKRGFHLTHNATYPITVPAICALLTTKEGDTILDCFSGTSVTGEFAIMNNRKFIGYEIKPEFVMASEVRISKHFSQELNEKSVKNSQKNQKQAA